MRRQVPFASFDVPDDWEDQSTYQFVSQPKKSVDVPLAGGRGGAVQGVRTSVVINRVALAKGQTPDEVIHAQSEMLRMSFKNVESPVRSLWKHPRHGEIVTISTKFDAPPTAFLQRSCYFPRSEKSDIVVVSFTTERHGLATAEPMMKEIFDKFALAT